MKYTHKAMRKKSYYYRRGVCISISLSCVLQTPFLVVISPFLSTLNKCAVCQRSLFISLLSLSLPASSMQSGRIFLPDFIYTYNVYVNNSHYIFMFVMRFTKYSCIDNDHMLEYMYVASICVCFFGNACRLFLIYSFLDASFFMHDDNDEKKLYVMIQYYEYDLRSTRLLLSSVKLFQPVAITGGAFTSPNTISFLLSATVFSSQFVYSISFSIFHLALLATATTNQII